MCKLLAFSGSLRQHSYNHSIVVAASEGARAAGCKVTIVHLNDFKAPLFSEEDEAVSGIPDGAKKLKTLMMEHDGFLIATPEYNSSYSAALKNAIDWASRMEDGEKPLQAFKGKTAVIMAASPGALGGIRALAALRTLLANIGMYVHPAQQAIGKVSGLVDTSGKVVDEATLKKLHALGKQSVTYTNALKNG
ncbi:NADPH-dependent FMN reductase [Glaciecola punicea ACAM 611]|uniref:NADPH-dependent FMN reductase n=1 Tax=Glaciecola punicea ACAM 611 TaxID=1121923 RepID=H5TBD5_9ALTE|nr:NAD(P)H-dependent oxidoreductase [Glaciecola punicea]GAB55612.1 NADPH-dependent FMN reductase [Glaciecola punicea ACAM 611]